MSKPKQIKITKPFALNLTKDKVYDILNWDNTPKRFPIVIGDNDRQIIVIDSEWEPVLSPGDKVWAWDVDKNEKKEGLYIGKSNFKREYPYYVDVLKNDGIDKFVHVEWCEEKKQITIAELAKKAGINLNEYEVIE